MMTTRPLRCLFALAAASLATGCAATYSHTDISQVSSNELQSQVNATHIQVTHGGIVTAHIAPFNSDGNPMVGDVASEDTSVIQVYRATGDNNYALLGVKPGRTHLEFKADGVTVVTIDTEVTEQAVQ
jgi:hypothetical protein